MLTSPFGYILMIQRKRTGKRSIKIIQYHTQKKGTENFSEVGLGRLMLQEKTMEKKSTNLTQRSRELDDKRLKSA